MATIYGGDEVNACVLDVGTHSVKAGYAGDDTPKAVFPSACGVVDRSGGENGSNGTGAVKKGGAKKGGEGGDEGGEAGKDDTAKAGADKPKRDVFVGNDGPTFRREGMEVVSPFDSEGQVSDWDLCESLWRHALADRLRLTDLADMALLVVEPTHASKQSRERCVERLFESVGCPAAYLAKAALLASFATARQTGVVVDSGHMATTVAVVHEGYVLNKSVVRSPLAGAALNQLIRAAVEARPAPGAAAAPAATTTKRGAAAAAAAAAASQPATLKILPRHLFRRVQKDPPDGPWKTERLEPPPGTTSSFTEYAVLQIAADLKEALCRVSDLPLAGCGGDGGDGAGGGAGAAGAAGGAGDNAADGGDVPTVAYELPDGTEIQVGAERFRAPEALFQPGVLASWPGGGCTGAAALPADAEALRSALPALVAESVARCDVDARRELYSGVVLTGGTSLLPSLRERLERELADNVPVPGTRVKVVAPTSGVERRFGPWIGGSILASLGSFQQMWMSKQEYDEHGAALIHRKSP